MSACGVSPALGVYVVRGIGVALAYVPEPLIPPEYVIPDAIEFTVHCVQPELVIAFPIGPGLLSVSKPGSTSNGVAVGLPAGLGGGGRRRRAARGRSRRRGRDHATGVDGEGQGRAGGQCDRGLNVTAPKVTVAPDTVPALPIVVHALEVAL